MVSPVCEKKIAINMINAMLTKISIACYENSYKDQLTKLYKDRIKNNFREVNALFFLYLFIFLIEIILILIFPIYLSSSPTSDEVNTLYLILKVECGKFQQRKQHVQRPKDMGRLQIVLRFILWERTRTISED